MILTWHVAHTIVLIYIKGRLSYPILQTYLNALCRATAQQNWSPVLQEEMTVLHVIVVKNKINKFASDMGGRFFIASDRSDWSRPVCLSFFYSSERFVPRFLMTDWSRRSARIFVGVFSWTTLRQVPRPFVYFLCANSKMDKSDKNYVFALYFIMLTDVYVKTVSDSSIPYLFIKDRWMQ